MTKFELQNHTKKFHVHIIKLSQNFPRNAAGHEIAKQLIRSAGSVGANCRTACRGKLKADFIYKIDVVLEEADETLFWLEVSKKSGLLQANVVDDSIKEANELVNIFNASDLTAKRNVSQNPKINKSQNQK